MTRDIIRDPITPLPRPPEGWFDYGYAVLCSGELALLRTDCDIRGALARWRNEIVKSGITGQRPSLGKSRLRLSAFDGAKESVAIEVPAGHWPKVDRLPDGRWLVVSDPPEPPYDIDARFYAADGAPVGTFAMGSYMTHVQCATDGTIWAGYFDEGVFGGSDIAGAGIARFDGEGQVIWRFNDQAGSDLSVDDCYALALDGATLWSCFYSDFPIIRVAQGRVTHWRNELSGARTLAVDGDHVLLVGGYKENSSRLALLHLVDGEASLEGQWRFAPPDRGNAGLVQGRDGILHIIGGGQWRRIAVATLRERCSRDDYQPDRPV